MTTHSDGPEVLRQEISAMLDRISDRGSLLYFLWLLRRIAKNESLSPTQELKKLRAAFVRVAEALDDKTKELDWADWALVEKYMNSGNVQISRPLGMAVKFYRERNGLTRVQLSKRCQLLLRGVIALERGQVKDMSLPRLEQLAKAVGVESGDLMNKVMEFARANN